MKPARIHVFDGLRVATEHIDHLQDGLNSSIEDLREAVGLGRVVRGFDVTLEGTGVVVGPGVAFDQARHRIATDEPQRLDVTFQVGQDEQYLCAQYERVEDHEIEGKPTFVWDSMRLVLQPTRPAVTEESVPLAKLVRAPDGASFRVVGVDTETPTEGPPSTTASTTTTTTETVSATESATGSTTESTSTTETLTDTTSGTETTTETASATETATATATAVPLEPATPAASQGVRLRQGIVALAATDDTGMHTLAAALRAALGGEPNDRRVTVGSTDVAVEFPPVSLTSDGFVSAELQPAAGVGWRSSGTARGEVTLADGQVLAQYGLTSGLRRALGADDGVGVEPIPPDLANGCVASLSLAPGAASSAASAVDHVALVVRATAAQSGFGFTCELVWSGDLDQSQVAALESEALALTWNVQIGWKGAGA